MKNLNLYTTKIIKQMETKKFMTQMTKANFFNL